MTPPRDPDPAPDPASTATLPSRWLVLLASLSLAACGGVLDPKGPIGAANRTILIDSLAIMLAIVVPTVVATLAFAWWFRASNERARYRPDWAFSGRLELVVWAIPVMVILLLGGVTWIGAHQLDPARPIASKTAPLEIQVVSLDWKWLFIYPDQRVATLNQLVVPVGAPLHFSLTSGSVMNAFFIPQLGSMIYTMNGMTTQLWLQADHAGTYHGQSSHFSGDGFSDMSFLVRAVPAEEFAAWVTATRDKGGALDVAGYTELARQGTAPRSTFGSVEVGLFERVALQHLPPGPGPALERGGAVETSPKAGH